MYTTISIIFTLLCFIEWRFSPRIDITRERDILLFYGRRTRKFIKLGKYGTPNQD